MDDKYTATFYHNSTQKGPIYIDSITAVPYNSYNSKLMEPLALDLSNEFLKECSEDNLRNHPEVVSDFCKQKIFSLTTDFNAAALSCDCVAQGSESFQCEEYGGQCKCKANVIGRRCERCAPGYYNFPECISEKMKTCRICRNLNLQSVNVTLDSSAMSVPASASAHLMLRERAAISALATHSDTTH